MFIKSFRLKNAAITIGAVLFGLALGLGVLFLASRTGEASLEPVEKQLTETAPAGKTVWLTFDDGPSAQTEKILDVLKEKNVPATFFVIGSTTERGKALYKRIVEEGHSLGIHSYSHRYNEIYQSADAYIKDFQRLSKHLKECAGVEPNIFRFPGGSNNRHADAAVLEEIKQRMKKDGKVWFDWNARAKDGHAQATPADQMVQNVLKSAGDCEQILILLHDDALRTTAADCVSQLIDHYQAEGFTFAALTPETVPVQFPDRKS